jgi:hypothetical protein
LENMRMIQRRHNFLARGVGQNCPRPFVVGRVSSHNRFDCYIKDKVPLAEKPENKISEFFNRISPERSLQPCRKSDERR